MPLVLLVQLVGAIGSGGATGGAFRKIGEAWLRRVTRVGSDVPVGLLFSWQRPVKACLGAAQVTHNASAI